MAELTRVDSHDVNDVEEMWGRYVPSARVHRIDPKNFGFQWRSVQTEALAVVRYGLTAVVNSDVSPEDQVLACRVNIPRGSLRSARAELDPTLPWISDGAPIRAHWDGRADVSAFIFDRERAQAMARRITGDDSLIVRVSDVAPRTEAVGRHWNRVFAHVFGALADDIDDPLMEATLVRHALVTTLSAFYTPFFDAASREPRLSGASAVRRAIAYMEAHAQEPITIDDVAREAHISTRGLQYAFRRALDTTPTAYLRRVRLDGARRDLHNADQSVSSAVVARRWGFSNPTRFRALYCEEYGHTPGQARAS